jgi:ABC-type transport system involved in cytochrome bd biosynthesis fused ATPase/permease subunit
MSARIAGVVLGSILLRLVVAVAIAAGLPANTLKLVTAVLVLVVLVVPDSCGGAGSPRRLAMADVSARARTTCATASSTGTADAATGAPTLEAQNISHTFERDTANEVQALIDVSLTLMPGDFVTVVGMNGSGKVDAAERGGGRVPARRGQHQARWRRRHEAGRAPARATCGARVPGPAQGYRHPT